MQGNANLGNCQIIPPISLSANGGVACYHDLRFQKQIRKPNLKLSKGQQSAKYNSCSPLDLYQADPIGRSWQGGNN